MTSVALQDIREEIKKYIDQADEKVVKMVHAMLEAAEEDETAYFNEILKRTKEYENGEVGTMTLNQLEEGARGYAKSKLKSKK